MYYIILYESKKNPKNIEDTHRLPNKLSVFN
jgi:hypothetical protein